MPGPDSPFARVDHAVPPQPAPAPALPVAPPPEPTQHGPSPAPTLQYVNTAGDLPFGNRVLVERHEDGGVTYLLPAPGMAREIPGVIVFGGLCAACGVAAFAMLVAAVIGETPVLMFLPVPLGGAILFNRLLRAHCRAATEAHVMSLRGGVFTQYSPAALGNPSRSWPVDEIQTFGADLRGVGLDAQLSADLEMRCRQRTVLLFSGLPRRQAEWIADGLRAALAAAKAGGGRGGAIPPVRPPVSSR